jgi:hypothetical protein
MGLFARSQSSNALKHIEKCTLALQIRKKYMSRDAERREIPTVNVNNLVNPTSLERIEFSAKLDIL